MDEIFSRWLRAIREDLQCFNNVRIYNVTKNHEILSSCRDYLHYVLLVLFKMEMTLVTALRCRDELFLASIFDWLIEKNLTDRLLEVSIYRCIDVACLLYCTVLYYIILYCAVLYCAMLYFAMLYFAILYISMSYCAMLYCSILYGAMMYCTVSRWTFCIFYFSPVFSALLCCFVRTYTIVNNRFDIKRSTSLQVQSAFLETYLKRLASVKVGYTVNFWWIFFFFFYKSKFYILLVDLRI